MCGGVSAVPTAATLQRAAPVYSVPPSIFILQSLTPLAGLSSRVFMSFSRVAV